MQSVVNQRKQLPVRGLKQVKVDNWGTFFLQRLQQLYFEEELLDLTIKFPTSDITVQAHRLVITTCTDYFVQLERRQREQDENFDGVIIMPPDMPYECVKSIISFMYTGQLEYWTSEQNALYRTAQKMNMTVLTKLLDAQFSKSASQNNQPTSPQATSETLPAQPQPKQNTAKKSSSSPTLPTQVLPGRKLPIWKRQIESRPSIGNYDFSPYHGSSLNNKSVEITPGPSRFDLPEVEDYALGVFSSFDDITYNTKPIVQAIEKDNDAEERGPNYKSIEDNDAKAASSDDEDDLNQRNQQLNDENSDDDWTGPKSILRQQEGQPPPLKKVRFDVEEKENVEKGKNAALSQDPADAINNHAKIIREVLKKYPHLVKNNKNIRLKIMQKETNSAEPNMPAKTKVSYVVLKSDHLLGSMETEESKNGDGCETGPWKCNKCNLEEEYTNYCTYRRHMQDVHDEKFDPRVCEHCGYKATKRNILMYHLYTKHNVPPPKNMSFPKCHACSYVALSETLLVRHQINHNHRPTSRLHSSELDSRIQCMQCLQSFKDVAELASHEIHTGHGGADVREKGHRCPHCGKHFVRLTNLQVHLDCAHKDLRAANAPSSDPLSLEPSSEAEALSHVASGIATSLGVDDSMQAEEQNMNENQSEYIVSEMSDISHSTTYNGQEIDGQQMIMLIDNDSFQQEHQHQDQQQMQEMVVSNDEQIVMQDSDDHNMIVYIQSNGNQLDQQAYTTYSTIEMAQDGMEEIVEEVVEEVEEGEEEYLEEGQTVLLDDGNVHQVEEVIQYVEYDDNQQEGPNDGSNMETDEAVMIIEDEQVGEDENKEHYKEYTKSEMIANEWIEENADVTRS